MPPTSAQLLPFQNRHLKWESFLEQLRLSTALFLSFHFSLFLVPWKTVTLHTCWQRDSKTPPYLPRSLQPRSLPRAARGLTWEWVEKREDQRTIKSVIHPPCRIGNYLCCKKGQEHASLHSPWKQEGEGGAVFWLLLGQDGWGWLLLPAWPQGSCDQCFLNNLYFLLRWASLSKVMPKELCNSKKREAMIHVIKTQ